MMDDKYFDKGIEYLPWYDMTEAEKAAQAAWHERLTTEYGAKLAPGAFVSPLAHIYGVNKLEIGDGSMVVAGCLVREIWLTMGQNSSLNTNSYIQGRVTIGDYVRVAPGASVIGMNHAFDSIEKPIIEQGLTHKGIQIGDDVWIGANAVVLDGVTIGAHAVVGAGAVVTKDIPAYAVAVGNPARVVKSRLDEAPIHGGDDVAAFIARARAQLPDVLAYYGNWDTDAPAFANRHGGEADIRPVCDAAELLAMFGAVSELLGEKTVGWCNTIAALQTDDVDYHVLTTGYALEALGAEPPKPYAGADKISAALVPWLEALPWQKDAWGAGAAVDHLATAYYFNRRYHKRPDALAELLGWLLARQDAATGLWGGNDPDDLHLPVNGFYRLTRGSFCQFGLPVPRPQRVVDSILRQAHHPLYFGPHRGNACDVLDIIHPLLACARETGHRAEEGRRWAEGQIARILRCWQDGKGLPFELEREYTPTLQGTEMWLSILHYLCVYTGRPTPGFGPKGVHRLASPITVYPELLDTL